MRGLCGILIIMCTLACSAAAANDDGLPEEKRIGRGFDVAAKDVQDMIKDPFKWTRRWLHACPFLAFCDAQRGDCHGSCGALAGVLEWSNRPAWIQNCSDSCDAQYSSCTTRLSPRCLDRENWH